MPGKKHPFTKQSIQNTTNLQLQTQEKPVDLFNDDTWELVFTPAITLLTWVPLQRFLLL